MSNWLSVQNLSVEFKVGGSSKSPAILRALRSVSMEVNKGTVYGIVGESGCGKSTTARLLMRLLDPGAGEMIFDGDAVGRDDLGGGIALKEYRRQVQMVFQDSYASLNPRLPIEDSIAFAPQVHGVPPADWSSQ